MVIVATAGLVSSAGKVHGAEFGWAVVALAVSVAGVGFVFSRWCRSDQAAIVAFVAVGLAGSALAALIPNTPAFVLVYLALAGLGIAELPVWPFAAAAVVFAAVNVAMLLSASGWPVSAMISQDIGAAFTFGIGLFIRSARQSRAAALAAQERAEDLLAQLAASQEAQAQAAALTERARLAREIHDVLAHTLSGLVLTLDTMELLARQGGADPGTVERILAQVARGQRIARDGLADTRRAISALRGDELPGAALLPRLVHDAAAAGVRASLTVTGDPRPLLPEAGLALYRTAQEALTNTAKYAGRAAAASLELAYQEDSVELLIQDTPATGAGPPAPGPGDVLTFGGYGLTGMRERAELLGGTLTAGPEGPGFAVRLCLPVPPADQLPATSPAHPRGSASLTASASQPEMGGPA